MVQALFTIAATLLFYLRHPVRTLKGIWHSLRSQSKTSDKEERTDMSGRGRALQEGPGAAGASRRRETCKWELESCPEALHQTTIRRFK